MSAACSAPLRGFSLLCMDDDSVRGRRREQPRSAQGGQGCTCEGKATDLWSPWGPGVPTPDLSSVRAE